MRSEIKSTFILCIYIVIMLVICALAVKAIKNVDNTNNGMTESTDEESSEIATSDVTQIIYIPIITETESEKITEAQIESETEEVIYTIKIYEGKIGIFTDNGSLVRVLEVYVKTLPKTDQKLLEKGVSVTSEAALRSIIEDYMG